MNTGLFWFFDSPRETRFFRWYHRVFSIAEIEGSRALQWVFGATIFSYYVAFSSWIATDTVTVNGMERGIATCWPYFQNCTDYYVLYSLPFGYSQTTLYMGLLAVLAAIVFCMHKREWILAHLLLVIPFLWHSVTALLLTQGLTGNYDYYLIGFASIVLFSSHKEYFLKVLLVSFYFLSTAVKIHDAWIVGTYFSAMSTGLPWFPDWSIPFLTNQLIFMEMVGAWFLLSNHKLIQRIVTGYFIFFHFYSGVLVEYRYPSTVLPTLIILFALFYRYQRPPFDAKAIIGWALVGVWFVAQSVPFFITGDQKYTLEANRIGLHMFESNHQCVSTVTYEYTDGTSRVIRKSSDSARNRCNPFDALQHIQYWCAHSTKKITRASWTFDHSINGRPFHRQVDERDACTLVYKPWSHNAWIRDQQDAPVVGYPRENRYY